LLEETISQRLANSLQTFFFGLRFDFCCLFFLCCLFSFSRSHKFSNLLLYSARRSFRLRLQKLWNNNAQGTESSSFEMQISSGVMFSALVTRTNRTWPAEFGLMIWHVCGCVGVSCWIRRFLSNV